MKRLFRRKGFTLVECIVAIAVFAVLVSMVLMIISSTVTASSEATKNEKDVNNLVENVVMDQSRKKFDSNSKTLEMVIGESKSYGLDSSTHLPNADSFVMSYTAIDGAKNFIWCPSCKHIANNSEFMDEVFTHSSSLYITASDAVKEAYGIKPTTWYNQSIPLKCPQCSTELTGTNDISLECKDCNNRGSYQSTTLFGYNALSGCFYCASCGSYNVSALMTDSGGVTEYVTDSAETQYSVSGLYADAIKYGTVTMPDPPADIKDTDLITFNKTNGDYGTSDVFYVSLSYALDSNPNKPGTYTLTISGLTHALDSAGKADITISLPGIYTPVPAKTTEPGHAEIGYTAHVGTPTTYSSINITGLSSTVNTVSLGFTLINTKNGIDFSYDYPPTAAAAGSNSLINDWFALTPSGSATNIGIATGKTSTP